MTEKENTVKERPFYTDSQINGMAVKACISASTPPQALSSPPFSRRGWGDPYRVWVRTRRAEPDREGGAELM